MEAIREPGRIDMRIKWIEACLRYAGSFSSREKSCYKAMLDVSDATVSSDMRRMVDIANRGTGEDVLAVTLGQIEMLREMPDTGFLPYPSVQDWLRVFAGQAYVKVDDPRHRTPDRDLVRVIYSAITSKCPVSMAYSSKTSEPSRRIISPHRIVDVAGRMHARAWDHGKNGFRDFVMTRMTSAFQTSEVAFVSSAEDRVWRLSEDLVVQLTEDHLSSSPGFGRMDFGLDDQGARYVKNVRQALIPYLIDAEGAFKSPVSVRRIDTA